MNYSIYVHVHFWFTFLTYSPLCCIAVDIKLIWRYLLNFILYLFEKKSHVCGALQYKSSDDYSKRDNPSVFSSPFANVIKFYIFFTNKRKLDSYAITGSVITFILNNWLCVF